MEEQLVHQNWLCDCGYEASKYNFIVAACPEVFLKYFCSDQVSPE